MHGGEKFFVAFRQIKNCRIRRLNVSNRFFQRSTDSKIKLRINSLFLCKNRVKRKIPFDEKKRFSCFLLPTTAFFGSALRRHCRLPPTERNVTDCQSAAERSYQQQNPTAVFIKKIRPPPFRRFDLRPKRSLQKRIRLDFDFPSVHLSKPDRFGFGLFRQKPHLPSNALRRLLRRPLRPSTALQKSGRF